MLFRSVDLGYVGDVTEVKVKLIKKDIAEGFMPVISPVAEGLDGKPYNVNADLAAGRVASALRARRLVYMSDVPGLLSAPPDPASLISTLKISQVDDLKKKGVIDKGMRPKVQSAIRALDTDQILALETADLAALLTAQVAALREAQLRALPQSDIQVFKTAQIAGYTIAGKTGTAQKVVNGRYSNSDFNVSFAGFVPSRAPRYTIVVVVDSPHKVRAYGSIVAGPIFQKIADAALRQAALDLIEADYVRDIEPGEVLKIRDGKIEELPRLTPTVPAACIFELIYFARPDSVIWEIGRAHV